MDSGSANRKTSPTETERTGGRLAAVVRRIGISLRRALRPPRATITDEGIEIEDLGFAAPWRDVLALFRHREHGRACLRNADGSVRQVALGAMSQTECDAAQRRWAARIVAEIKERGYLEGTTLNRLPHPRRYAVISAVLATLGCALAGHFLVAMHRRLAPLLDAAELWLLLGPFIAGAVAIVATLLTSAWSTWRQTRLVEAWQHWRLDCSGLSRALATGGWTGVPFGPGDRIGTDAVIGGDPVPIEYFSGGDVTWKLLAGLGRRHGVSLSLSGGYRTLALRCCFLWMPLIGLAWLLPVWVADARFPGGYWKVLLMGEALCLLTGGSFLWLHHQLGRKLRDIVATSGPLLEELGW